MSNNKYPPIVRRFSLSLHYLSPRAYEYVRDCFNKNLPHFSTLRQWYTNSEVLAEPGINSAVIEQLKLLVAKKDNSGQKLIVSLSFDEMNIRRHVQWCNSTKRLIGYATVGNEAERKIVAKQALVFMVNGVNERMNLTVGHYFISSLNAQGRKDLLIAVVRALLECGVIVSNITFDGLPANGKMCDLLGATLKINSPSFKPSFHVDESEPIHIIYDHCHMLKLMRNTLGNNQILFNSSGGRIKWNFIDKLVEYSGSHGFKGMHKLTKSHIQWKRKVMNVLIAVQTLSESTASSIEFLMNQGHEDFKDATATIEFFRMCDKLFDIFNTKGINNKGTFKSAMNATNMEKILKFFEYAENYIIGMKIKNHKGKLVNIVNSKIRTGFIGFIINIRAVRNIYGQYVSQKLLLSFIPTYRLCQDPLEIHFGKIRSLNGFNDNPTIQQFSAAFRKLLVNADIQSSKFSNCNEIGINNSIMDTLKTVSSRKKKHPKTKARQNDHFSFHEINQVDLTILYEGLHGISTAYQANLIEQKIKNSSLYCKDCSNIFVENERNPLTFGESACQSTVEICTIVKTYMNLEILQKTSDFNVIYSNIFREVDVEQMFAATDFSHDPSHKLYLIRFIIDAAIQINGTVLAREATFNEHRNFFRSQFKKYINFYGQ